MTTTSAIASTATAASATSSSYGFSSLGAKDFIRMLTAELSQQDPTAPVDQKEMLAQMAQFSSLSQAADTNTAIGKTNAALGEIADKLDKLIAAQKASATDTLA